LRTVRIQKAVITAAGPTQRSLPLQTLVDRDGTEKSALAIILEEAQSADIEDVCVVVHPGDEEAYAAALATSALRITYTPQDAPRGYGHALFCAREFVGDDPFLHFVSDHLYVGHGEKTCAQELVAVAERESAAVSAVQATRESMLPYYGAVGGQRVPNRNDIYAVQHVVEKPTPTQAEQDLLVPGLRAGHYLCLFGMHSLTPTVMDLLAEDVEAAGDSQINLAGALTRLANKERYLAFEVPGRRYNIGVKYGLLNAQLALALSGVDRMEVLTQLVELLATREITANAD
jgi:UTP--glucose-1-phosphate uridylyltransferase